MSASLSVFFRPGEGLKTLVVLVPLAVIVLLWWSPLHKGRLLGTSVEEGAS